ncbi:MAG TPA: hypothetical protein PLH94_13055 [Fimbriimonadaceae bacterium]|nr:hypothetical protein [Fimbriimonadaceae bacterium]
MSGALLAVLIGLSPQGGWQDLYESGLGGFTIVPPLRFGVWPKEEQGKETAELVRFTRRDEGKVARLILYRFSNPKGLTLERWAKDGRYTWVAELAYEESRFQEVDWLGAKAWVHEFRFATGGIDGKPRDRFRAKSVRFFRGTTGYWIFFHCHASMWDDVLGDVDASIKTLKFKP